MTTILMMVSISSDDGYVETLPKARMP
jgi:hypothetical protein